MYYKYKLNPNTNTLQIKYKYYLAAESAIDTSKNTLLKLFKM